VSESTRGRRKSLIGTVVSVKMDKTAVVSVERRYPHQLYHKIVRSTKRYKAHDPENAAVLGDTVRIVETRPISKQKRWRIAATLTRGNVADIAPREIGVPEEGLYHPERPEPTPATPETSLTAEDGAAVIDTLVEGEAVDPETSEPEAELPADDAPAVEAEEAPATEAEEAPAEDAAEGGDKE
jgi:small subunit ribosomal protein S17